VTQPTILAFDTAAPRCAAALLCGDTIVTRIDEMARGQAEHLMPMLAEMLRAAGLTWRDLDAVGVGIGPGNFTGIRISVAAARGLALGLGVPAIGVSTLEAQVWGFDTAVVSCLAAPQGRVYAQYGIPIRRDPPRLCEMTRASLPRCPGGAEVSVIGDVADAVGEILDAPTATARVSVPEGIARIAAARRAVGGPIPRPAPLYVRAPDAAPPRDAPPRVTP